MRENDILPMGKTNTNDSGFLIRHLGSKKKVARYFSSAGKQELSTHNPAEFYSRECYLSKVNDKGRRSGTSGRKKKDTAKQNMLVNTTGGSISSCVF